MDGNKKLTGIVFAAIIALAITACKVQLPNYVGLYVDNLISVTDTTDPGTAPLNTEDTVMAQGVDTTVVIEADLPVFFNPVEENFDISSDSVYQYKVEKLLSTITDSIQLLNYQMIELQKQISENPNKGFTEEKSKEFQQLNSQQTDNSGQQLLKAKDEQIKMLQNRYNSIQTSAAKTPQRTPVTMVVPLQPLGSQQHNQLTQQTIQAQNDTIQFLKNQIKNLQPERQKTDTVYIENEAREQQTKPEPLPAQNTSELQQLVNMIPMLEKRIQSLEEQTLPVKDTPVIAMQEERDASFKEKSDTTLIVAFYKLGVIKPIEDESVLKQIKELCNNKHVMKITLTGYTDNSGNATINKKITTRRLNYLSEKMISWISKEKIFLQNFGDTFASDTMINDERRIEIRIHTK